MHAFPLSVKEINKVDRTSFSILWSDGIHQTFSLADVQRHCPCAGCVDKKIENNSQSEVYAKRLSSVGRYALRIDFTTGCSAGIYDYPLLRRMRGEK